MGKEYKEPKGRNGGAMLKLEYDKKEIEGVIDKIVKKTMNMDLTWDWPCGVAYYGISDAYEKTGKKEYLDLLKDRIDELIDLGLPKVWTVNACAMGHCLITLYQATGEQQYHDILMSKIAYLRKDALRFGDHVLQHTVSANNDFPEQCWCDTLFMAAFLMLRVGVMEHDEELIDDALNQYYWHIKYLQNPSSGLWYHGYDNIAGDHMSGIYWGRANAWAAFTMSQVGGILPQCYLYPKYIDVAGSLNEQLAALKVYQTENGYVDEPTVEVPTNTEQPLRLRDFLLGDQETLLERIKLRVSTQHTGTDLARLYFALQEEQLLSCCDVTTFHRLLANEMPDCDLKSIRNLQIAIKKLNDSTNKGKIKDCGMERTYIDEWRSYLTNAD